MTKQRTFSSESDAGALVPARADGKRLVYCKDGVSVNPERADGTAVGFLSVVEHVLGECTILWTPHSLLGESLATSTASAGSSGSEAQAAAAVFTISIGVVEGPQTVIDVHAMEMALRDVHSFRRVVPGLGVSRLTVHSKEGWAYPEFFFSDGGLKDFVQTVNMFATLTESPGDRQVLLVNDMSSQLQRTLSGLGVTTNQVLRPAAVQSPPSPSRREGGSSWSLLEQLSTVTRLARQTSGMIAGLRNQVVSNNVTRPVNPEQQRVLDEFERNRDSRLTDKILGTAQEASTPVGTFEILDRGADDAREAVDRTPLSVERFETYFRQADGSVAHEDELRKAIFYGGMDAALRRTVWKYLLDYVPFAATAAQQTELFAERRTLYLAIKQQWQSIVPEQERYFGKYRDRRHRVEKDVVRTDREVDIFVDDDGEGQRKLRDILLTYGFYNFDLGYVQGMSDLLAPILHVMEDEADAFWCFVGYMETMRNRFDKDQHGIHHQLGRLSALTRVADPQLFQFLENKENTAMLFCYRWILIMFKREFEFFDVMALWERIWTHHLSPNFHIFLCVAILEANRQPILERELEFDDTLKFVNDLAMHIPLQATFEAAERLFHRISSLPNLPHDVLDVLHGPAVPPSATH